MLLFSERFNAPLMQPKSCKIISLSYVSNQLYLWYKYRKLTPPLSLSLSLSLSLCVWDSFPHMWMPNILSINNGKKFNDYIFLCNCHSIRSESSSGLYINTYHLQIQINNKYDSNIYQHLYLSLFPLKNSTSGPWATLLTWKPVQQANEKLWLNLKKNQRIIITLLRKEWSFLWTNMNLCHAKDALFHVWLKLIM